STALYVTLLCEGCVHSTAPCITTLRTAPIYAVAFSPLHSTLLYSAKVAFTPLHPASLYSANHSHI
ncbi:hypothetical protein NDU88_000046, partial [Pleurodeles waltl]